MARKGLVEDVRRLLLEHDLAGIDGSGDEYSEEARAVVCQFGDASSAGELADIVYQELDLAFAGLAGEREEYAALGVALWRLRSGD